MSIWIIKEPLYQHQDPHHLPHHHPQYQHQYAPHPHPQHQQHPPAQHADDDHNQAFSVLPPAASLSPPIQPLDDAPAGSTITIPTFSPCHRHLEQHDIFTLVKNRMAGQALIARKIMDNFNLEAAPAR